MSFCVMSLSSRWSETYFTSFTFWNEAPLPVFFSEHHSSFSSMSVGFSMWPEYDKLSHNHISNWTSSACVHTFFSFRIWSIIWWQVFVCISSPSSHFHSSPIIITHQHHMCYSHAQGSQCGFLSELPSAKAILWMECDPQVRVNHPHRQLQLYGGRNLQEKKGSASTQARPWASWMQSKSGILFVMLWGWGHLQ